MSDATEAARALPGDFDVTGLSGAFNNPTAVLQMLDKNNDGRVTKDDLELLLQQFRIQKPIAKIIAKYMFKELDANGNGTLEASDLTHANGILTRLMKMKPSGGAHE